MLRNLWLNKKIDLGDDNLTKIKGTIIKMSSLKATPLNLPNLDSICDAKFVKSMTEPSYFKTKKELVTFLQEDENEDVLNFFRGMESQLKEKQDDFRENIKSFFTTIPDRLKEFREEAKKLEKIRKKQADELREQEIIERYLKKQELEKQKEEILAKAQPNDSQPNETQQKETQQNETQSKIQNKNLELPKSLAPKPKPKLTLKTSPQEDQQICLDIKDYLKIAQQLVKEELFEVFTDTGDQIDIQCLMMNDNKIRLIIKTE